MGHGDKISPASGNAHGNWDDSRETFLKKSYPVLPFFFCLPGTHALDIESAGLVKIDTPFITFFDYLTFFD